MVRRRLQARRWTGRGATKNKSGWELEVPPGRANKGESWKSRPDLPMIKKKRSIIPPEKIGYVNCVKYIYRFMLINNIN
jgi:hypothetical protein